MQVIYRLQRFCYLASIAKKQFKISIMPLLFSPFYV